MRHLVLFVLLLPLAAAHPPDDYDGARLADGTYLNHVFPHSVVLGPREATIVPLAWEGTPLLEDWLFLLAATVDEGTFVSQLRHDGKPVAQFRFDAGPLDFGTISVPETGFYELEVRNPASTGNLSATFYYDVTCDCLGKPIPLDMGPIWFQFRPHMDGRLAVESRIDAAPIDPDAPPSEPPTGARMKAHIATLSRGTGVWPNDFALQAVRENPDGKVDLSTSVTTNRTVYFLVQAGLTGPSDGWVAAVYPTFTGIEPVGKESPTPLLALLALLLAAWFGKRPTRRDGK